MPHFIQNVLEAFESKRNDEYALQMKGYMKNKFSFYGLKGPERREVSKQFLSKKNLPEERRLEEIVWTFWEMPYRELHYFALELLNKLAGTAPKERITFYETLVAHNSWWDSIDYIAPTLISKHFTLYPHLIEPYTYKWIEDESFWYQRCALIFQLKYKEKTDFELMKRMVLRRMDSKEFFVRKAIGWALREHAKRYPDEVLAFVEEAQLTGLSRREALKHFNVD